MAAERKGEEGDVLGFADLVWNKIADKFDDGPTKESANALVTAITTLGETINSKKTSLEKQIKELNEQNAQLRAQIAELEAQIATSETENTAEIKRLQKERDEAKVKLTANNTLIPKLMEALTKKIKELNAAMGDDGGDGAAAGAAGAAGGAGADANKYFQKYLKYKQKYLSIKN